MCPSSNDSSQRVENPSGFPHHFLCCCWESAHSVRSSASPLRMNMTSSRITLLLVLCCVCCGAAGSSVYRREQDGGGGGSSITAIGSNNTSSTAETPPATHGNDTAKVTRFSSIREHLPTIKSVFFFVCGFSSLLIICLIVKIFRSGKRIRKTRKYDIITTPAERVEMAPLNEDNFEDEDSTVFDVKYRYR